jgi:hypothetical protein
MIIIYMQATLQLLEEFPTPSRIEQTEKGAYVVYEFPVEESYQPMMA